MRPKPPEKYRFTGIGQFCTSEKDGNNGAFLIPLHWHMWCGHKVWANCIISDGSNYDGSASQIEWEHVSVHIEEYGKKRTPTWDEMCVIKNIFWEEEETVMQLHPPKSQWINVHPNVLHLWKPKSKQIPMPPQS